jgi:hypothetical protein
MAWDPPLRPRLTTASSGRVGSGGGADLVDQDATQWSFAYPPLSEGVSAPSEAWRFLAGCKSLLSTASPATHTECGSCEGGQSRTTQVKRTQGIPQTVGKPALPEA